MIIAEHSYRVQKESKDAQGSLHHKIGSYYSEFLIINYLNEPIYAVDHLNRSVLIQAHPTREPFPDNRKLEILSRSASGPRSYDPKTYSEITPNKHDLLTIPYDVLRDQPVFVEEMNAVLCFGDQLSIVRHPHSKAAKDELARAIHLEVSQAVSEAPIAVNANDPSGRIDELFIEINGVICATKVTHIEAEMDNVSIGLRNKPHSISDFTTHRTTFTELFAQDPRVWTLGGFRLSSSREWFEQVLDIERSKKPSFIEVSAVDALVKQARKEAEDKVKILTEENKDIMSRFKQLEATHDALKSGDYQPQNAELAFKKLALEQEKVRRSEVEAKLALDAERLKLRKELIATLGVVAKTAAVMVPVGFAIYKAIKAARSA